MVCPIDPIALPGGLVTHPPARPPPRNSSCLVPCVDFLLFNVDGLVQTWRAMHDLRAEYTGPHVNVRLEGDVVVVQTRGETTMADLEVIFRAYAQVRCAHQRVLALYDGREGRGMSSEARREVIASSTVPERQTDAVAVFGAPFAMQVFVNMLNRASLAIRQKALGIAMFATEAEARGYLDQERSRLVGHVPNVS